MTIRNAPFGRSRDSAAPALADGAGHRAAPAQAASRTGTPRRGHARSA